MKLIQLGGNRYKDKPIRDYTMVDDGDFKKLSKYKWFLSSNGYAMCNVFIKRKQKHLRMARFLINAKKGQIVDHINRNKLDNRKNNLRFVNKSQNGLNREAPITNTSGYKGIYWDKTNNKWRPEIKIMGKRYRPGRFEKISEAVKAYNQIVENYGMGYALIL